LFEWKQVLVSDRVAGLCHEYLRGNFIPGLCIAMMYIHTLIHTLIHTYIHSYCTYVYAYMNTAWNWIQQHNTYHT
jgi:hypothetical protein